MHALRPPRAPATTAPVPRRLLLTARRRSRRSRCPRPLPRSRTATPPRRAPTPASRSSGATPTASARLEEYCVGTLVGSRQILTAARCAIYGLGRDLRRSRASRCASATSSSPTRPSTRRRTTTSHDEYDRDDRRQRRRHAHARGSGRPPARPRRRGDRDRGLGARARRRGRWAGARTPAASSPRSCASADVTVVPDADCAQPGPPGVRRGRRGEPLRRRLRQPAARPRRPAVRGRGRVLRHGVRQPRGARAVRPHRRRSR